MKRDDGSGTVIAFMLVAMVASALVALVSLGALYNGRTRASAAADAAALAAAVASYPPAGGGDPVAEAARYAALNDSILDSCACPVDSSFLQRTVTVVVRTSVAVPFFGQLEVRAAARGEFDPKAWLTG